MPRIQALVGITAVSLSVWMFPGCAASEDGNTSGETGTTTDPNAVGGSSNVTATGGASSKGGASATGGAVASGGATSSQTSSKSTGGAPSTSAPSWAQLWTNYFQPACASCHASSATVGSRRVFANAAQMCTYLTSAGQLNGSASPALISTSQSILNWFSSRGSMPEGNTTVPANAVNDIKAWAAAGAVCP